MLVIPTAFFCRLLGMNVVITLHQVPLKNDIKERINSRIVRTNILYYGIKIIYWLISNLASKIIVHEDIFKRRIIENFKINKEKIVTIGHVAFDYSHNREKDQTKSSKVIGLEKEISKYRLKIMFFGYLSWYKGIYELIEDFVSLPEGFRSRISLTVVGGLHPNQTNEEGYMDWIKQMKSKTENMPNVIWYGYAEDEDINKIFSLHDAFILPYRNVFSSSGPFAWAISHELPIIVSNEMSYLSELGFLSYKVGGLEKVLKEFQSNQEKHKEIVSKVRASRSIQEVELAMNKVYK
jgi:glycosyltransferase involved in cell wall biosynthesis